MSLLMDALRQAEANQGDAQTKTEADTPAELSLAPDPSPSASPITTPRPPLPGSPGNTSSSGSAARTPRRDAAQAHAAARTLFEAKQTKTRPLALYLALGGALLLLPGAGYIAWHTLGHRGNIPVPQALPSPIPMQPAPPALAASAEGPGIEPASVSSAASPHQETRTDPQPPQPRAAAPRQTSSPAPALRHTPASAPPATGQETLDAAYAAYISGDLPLARRLLLQARQQSPLNTDVHLTLGMIALRSAESRLAERHFRDALEIDPGHAHARSQLIWLHAAADPLAAESRLRQLLSEQPESAEALFALGSLLAGQARWREAQQAFFKAHALDGGKPDTLYNLAVSLDHLQQPAQARHYYQLAASRSQGRAVAFDPDAARQRAGALALPAE